MVAPFDTGRVCCHVDSEIDAQLPVVLSLDLKVANAPQRAGAIAVHGRLGGSLRRDGRRNDRRHEGGGYCKRGKSAISHDCPPLIGRFVLMSTAWPVEVRTF